VSENKPQQPTDLNTLSIQQEKAEGSNGAPKSAEQAWNSLRNSLKDVEAHAKAATENRKGGLL
jgi:hypothetical protein